MPDANDKSEFVTRGREVATDIVNAVNLARTWLNWGAATAMLDSIADVDDPVFTSGEHEGLTKADLLNLANSLSALSTWYDGGHNTNLQSVANH